MEEKILLKEQAIEILEILKREGIDINKITTTKKVNGVKRTRYLCEVPDDKINYVIEKYNLDPNFKIGRHIKEMRNNSTSYDESDRKRIEQLGLNKFEKKENSRFKNQIEEGLYVLSRLKELGIDIPYIPQSINGKTSCLKDIACPDIKDIIDKIGYEEDYPIGLKIRTIISEYNGVKHDYSFGDKEKKQVEQLGIISKPEEIIEDTLNKIKILIDNNIDISDILDDIVINEKSRKKFLFELNDEKIEEIIKKYNLPKYFMIGQRANRLKTIIYTNLIKDDIKNQIRNLFFKEESKNEIVFKEEEEAVVSQTIKLIKKLNDFQIDISSISVTKFENGKQSSIKLKDLPLTTDQLKEITKEFKIDEEFNLGKRISNIRSAYNGTGAPRIKMTLDDKLELENLKIVSNQKNNAREFTNSEKIEMLEILQKFGIRSFKPTYQEDKKTKRTMLKMIGLDKAALEYFKERYGVDEEYRIGYIVERLRKSYRNNKLNDYEVVSLQKLGILTELDILEHEQNNLSTNLNEVKKYADKIKRKNQKESDEKII